VKLLAFNNAAGNEKGLKRADAIKSVSIAKTIPVAGCFEHSDAGEFSEKPPGRRVSIAKRKTYL
jgi:hypothetical protein